VFLVVCLILQNTLKRTLLTDHFIGSISVPIERLKKQDVLQEWFPLVAKGVGGVGAAAAAHFILDYKPGFSSYVGKFLT